MLNDLVHDLLSTDRTGKIICTARQAFYAQHPEAFPNGLSAFHLLDFDDNDIRACAINRRVDPDAFLFAVQEVECTQEIRNPFVLDVIVRD